MHTERPQDHVLGARLARWSKRSCALAVAPPLVALAFAIANTGDSESPLAAAALGSSFLGVLFGLLGLFGLTLAIDFSDAVKRPRWCVAFGIAGILGGFMVGLYGLISGQGRA